jgi:hypothetical protein
MNQLTQPTKPNNRSLIRILSELGVLSGLCVSFLITPAHADETLFDNYGSYVNIEHQKGLDTDRVLIINQSRVFIGDVEENGYFNAYGVNGSVWGSQTGAGQVIVVPSLSDEVE